ncbi:MAG: tetratricopeptide repeat protein [Planctomycetes bacterium]|nr:tetratricopeptide repeat protein [Planctomycetota bacterium]
MTHASLAERDYSKTTERHSPEFRTLTWLIPCVMLVTAVAHWPALSARAVSFDDHQYLLQNPLVKTPSWNSVQRFFTEVLKPSSVAGYYQPLSMTSLMLDVAMGGSPQNFEPLHRTSLLLHTLNTGLLALLLYRLFRKAWPAALAALLFGVHPLTIEPIPWIGERKTLLAAFFALISLCCYVRYARSRDSIPAADDAPRWYMFSLAAFLLALLSKPTTVPLSIAMILIDLWPLRRFGKKTLIEKIPFLALTALFAVITIVSQGRSSVATMPTEYPISRIPLTLCHNIFFYLWKFVWPVNLSSHYPFPSPMDLSHPMIRAGLIGTALLAAFVLASLRRTPAAAIGWLVWFVMILPTMQIVGFSDVIASDKYFYLPAVGLMMIVAWVLGLAWEKSRPVARRAAILAVVAVTIGLTTATRAHLSVWVDSPTFYQYMIRLTPNSAALHNNYAVELVNMQKLPEAIEEYRKALSIDPGDERTITNIGVALRAAGKPYEAIRLYKEALNNPKLSHSYSILVNLGTLTAEQGDTEMATEYFRVARMENPKSAEAQTNYANGLLTSGKYAEAVEAYREALELRPDIADIHNNLAVALNDLGRTEEAIQHFNMAVVLDPNHAGARSNLALHLAQLGQLQEALTHVRVAVKLQPNNTELLYMASQLEFNTGHAEESKELLRRVLAIDPGFEPAKELLDQFTFKQTADRVMTTQPTTTQASKPAP